LILSAKNSFKDGRGSSSPEKSAIFVGKKNDSLICEQFYQYLTHDLAGLSLSLFPLSIAPYTHARHSLQALAHTLLLTPNLLIAFFHEEKIQKAYGGGRPHHMFPGARRQSIGVSKGKKINFPYFR